MLTWGILLVLVAAHVVVLLRHRSHEVVGLRGTLTALEDAKVRGSHRAPLQYPHVDLTRCMGSATCIAACPEDGVLQLIHGQAMVVHGARCISCGNCARECPVGAITMTLGDVSDRKDLPVLSPDWESPQVPGVFLGGEVTAFALISTAIDHGTAIANVVADRLAASASNGASGTAPAGSSSQGSSVSRSQEPWQTAADPAVDAWRADLPPRAPMNPAGAMAQQMLAAVGALPTAIGDAGAALVAERGRGLLLTAGPSPGVVLLEPTTFAPPKATPPRAPLPGKAIDAGASPSTDSELLDLLIVGAGPAGLACSLQAKARGLRFLTLEQEALGGTVAKYPRRKLVMTQPVDLPLYGRMKKTTYTKEELMELWESIAREHELPIRTGEVFTGVERSPDGHLVVRTQKGVWRARHVCLAIGRRGTPRKLEVQGEDLPKVAYSLMDAESYQNRKLLVVGGGDSAVEAALSLASQPGNEVTLSYRKEGFFRIKSRNLKNAEKAIADGRLRTVFQSGVKAILPTEVVLAVEGPNGTVEQRLPNDEVFVMAGGIAPFKLLQDSGISFDPAQRTPEAPIAEQGVKDLIPALKTTLILSLVTLFWVATFRAYYGRDLEHRFDAPFHELLRPSGVLGLTCGFLATAAMIVNLLYLARRASWGRKIKGSLTAWMTSHVITGILSLLLVLVHAAMAPKDTVGGHAFWGLVILVATGAIGRYIYAFVPRAANGQEQSLTEVRKGLTALSAEWDQDGRGLGGRVRAEVDALVVKDQWQHSLPSRLWALLLGQRRFARALRRLRRELLAEGLADDQVERLTSLSRRAYRTALMAARYEDLRGLLNTWRFLHRWVALAMVLLLTWHIVTALRYGELF